MARTQNIETNCAKDEDLEYLQSLTRKLLSCAEKITDEVSSAKSGADFELLQAKKELLFGQKSSIVDGVDKLSGLFLKLSPKTKAEAEKPPAPEPDPNEEAEDENQPKLEEEEIDFIKDFLKKKKEAELERERAKLLLQSLTEQPTIIDSG